MKRISVLFFSIIIFFMAAAASQARDQVMVLSVSGEVKALPKAGTVPAPCKEGMALGQGSRVMTGEASSVEIAFNADKTNVVRVGEKSDVVIKIEGDDKIELINGEIFSAIEGLEPGEGFKIKTPCAVCAVRGTGWNTITDGNTASVESVKDTVTVYGVNKDASVMKKGYQVKQGFMRNVKKFEKPGKADKIDAKRYGDLRGDWNRLSGLGSPGEGRGIRTKMETTSRIQQKMDSKKEQDMSSVRERKDQERREDIMDERSDRNSGSSGGKFIKAD